MPVFSNLNGKIVSSDSICISPDNRSFKYGYGCFETMKVVQGDLPLGDLHFKRLFNSLQKLNFAIPDSLTPVYLLSVIKKLVEVNGHERLARVRLIMYAGEGGLYDSKDKQPNFIIQTAAGSDDSNYINSTGYHINIYEAAKINADSFSSIKSNNYLRYAMAAMWAKDNQLDDCILTNAFDKIADATIANVFIVSNGIIKTPSLSSGCVGGVMRQHLLACMKNAGIECLEAEITPSEILEASEVFLTNAWYGIRWVKKLAGSNYTNITSSFLHDRFIAPLFRPSTF